MEEPFRELENAVLHCDRCRLFKTRTHPAVGEGNTKAKVMFVGEGPGEEDDLQGRPFVGKAGQLLDRMMAAIGLDRKDVYIANIVKCRPPGNRNPQEDEMMECMRYLRVQYALIRPKIVVCLGSVAAKQLISQDLKITRDRGKWVEKSGTWFLPTYHPAALLRDESKKRDAWEDMKSLKNRIESIKD